MTCKSVRALLLGLAIAAGGSQAADTAAADVSRATGVMRYRPMLTIAVATVAAVAAATPGHAGTGAAQQYPSTWPPLSSAARFFLAELRDKTNGDWETAWRTLYPLHQRAAPQIDFVNCERTRPFSAELDAVRVVGVRKALVHVPGLARPVPGVAVDVHVELRWYGPRDPIVFRHTFHLVPVDRHWTWLLSPSRYRLYRDRDCLPAALAA